MKTYQTVIIALAIASCGKQESKTPTQIQYLNDNSSLYIEKSTDMPTCNEGNQRQLIYIKEVEQFQFCDSDKAWKVVSIAGGKDGKDGAKGKDGENGKDGVTKNFTVYSAGKPIGWLADENPEFFGVKTFKGYYFTVNSMTGKVGEIRTLGYRLAGFYAESDCIGKTYSHDTHTSQILARENNDKTGYLIYYTTKSWIKGTAVKSYLDHNGNCRNEVAIASPDYYNFAETFENNPDVTGFENKGVFELPITIGL